MKKLEAINLMIPLREKYGKSNLKGIDILNQFNNNELLAYIALATYSFGRSWEKSLENAEYHLENKDKAIKLFGTQKNDLMGGAT